MTDWLTDCQSENQMTDWITNWLTDWLTDHWLTDWLTEWLLTNWLQVRQSDDWLTDWLVDWLTGLLSGWWTDWLTDWLTNYWITDWLTDWLTNWLIDWLIDYWLANWLTDCKRIYERSYIWTAKKDIKTWRHDWPSQLYTQLKKTSGLNGIRTHDLCTVQCSGHVLSSTKKSKNAKERSYIWTAEKDMKTWLIIAVINTTEKKFRTERDLNPWFLRGAVLWSRSEFDEEVEECKRKIIYLNCRERHEDMVDH